jgi:hypothetical protein
MKLMYGAAIVAAAGALAVGVGSASAGAPEFGCYTQGGSFLFPVGSPGDEAWLKNVRDCLAVDKVVTHVAATKQ